MTSAQEISPEELNNRYKEAERLLQSVSYQQFFQGMSHAQGVSFANMLTSRLGMDLVLQHGEQVLSDMDTPRCFTARHPNQDELAINGNKSTDSGVESEKVHFYASGGLGLCGRLVDEVVIEGPIARRIKICTCTSCLEVIKGWITDRQKELL